MKRILSLALALLIACGCLTAVYATPACFGDVPSDAYFRPAVEWAIQGGITAGVDESHFGPHLSCTRAQAAYFRPAVEWAIQGGITAGVDESHFGPHLSCTRAQAMTFLWRAAGSPEPEGSAVRFSDVSPSDYYFKAVTWAVENGITAGVSDGVFGANQTCTRGFSDVSPSDYYFKAVTWAVENGITAGVSDGVFGANQTCTRGQIVTFLWRTAGSLQVSGSSMFADVSPSDYFFHPVAWAVANQVTAGMGNNQFGPNQPCTRAQIMTMLWKADQPQPPEPPAAGEETVQTSTIPVTGVFDYAQSKQILALVNQARRDAGVPELTWNTDMEQAAKVRAAECYLKFDHTRPDGKQILALVNQARRDAGVPELTWNTDMEQAAKVRAAECYLKFDHTRPDGSSCLTAHEQIRGENIAEGSTGYFDAKAIFDGWMNSDGHRENILRDSFTGITVAAVSVEDMTYWVQLFS